MGTKLKWGQKGVKWNDSRKLTWGGDLPDAGGNSQMSIDNEISESVAPETKTGFMTKMGEGRALLTFARNIPADKKRQYSGIAERRAGMDEVFPRLMTEHPELIPAGLSMSELNKDVAFRKDVKDMLSVVLQLAEMLKDTELISASDSMKAYRWFYNSVKAAAQHNVPGADALVTQMAPFFAHDTGSGGSNPTPSPAPGT
jgi:hypothetical protein